MSVAGINIAKLSEETQDVLLRLVSQPVRQPCRPLNGIVAGDFLFPFSFNPTNLTPEGFSLTFKFLHEPIYTVYGLM